VTIADGVATPKSNGGLARVQPTRHTGNPLSHVHHGLITGSAGRSTVRNQTWGAMNEVENEILDDPEA
jgi:hypothetical protein